METNHRSPLEVIQQAVRDIVALHRTTVQQLSELIRVQGGTTEQLQMVSEAMREVGALFRGMTSAQERVNEILSAVAGQLGQMAEVDAAIRQAVVALAEHFEQVSGQLAGVSVLLRQLLREQERVALAALAQEIERRTPSLFCRQLAQLRWGVPGVFFDELSLSEAVLEIWLSAQLAVCGVPRQGNSSQPLWVLVWVVPQLTEPVMSEVLQQVERLHTEFPRVVPAIAPLQVELSTDAVTERGVVVLGESVLRGWEAAVARWAVSPDS